MTLATETTDVGREWGRLRGILRFAILCGDVIEEGQDWQAWGPGGQPTGEPRGVDRGRRTEFWDVLKALYRLRSNDPLGHALLRHHVGYPCEGTRCRPIDEEWPTLIHWHQISRVDLRSRYSMKDDYLLQRREQAMAFVVEICAIS